MLGCAFLSRFLSRRSRGHRFRPLVIGRDPEVAHTKTMGGYEPLTEALRAAAARGQARVELGFGQIEEIIGRRLPASSDQRQWWANTAHSQALAWHIAGFHVEQVYLDRQRIRGSPGGRLAAATPIAAGSLLPRAAAGCCVDRTGAGRATGRRARASAVARRRWRDHRLGRKARVRRAGGDAGLYRMTLSGAVRRAAGRGCTSARTTTCGGACPATTATAAPASRPVCGSMRSCASTSPLATAATVWLDGEEQALDLIRKAARLLAENAAVVRAQLIDDAEIVNLG